jgi:ParB family chromosome partitioning protein
MTQPVPQIRSIPTDTVAVLNPRVRNKKVFNELVTSIANLGLKKPITVSRRKDGDGFDLVCGQGRLEAFIALGQTEIPAVVIEASEEDCFVMSLVENLARRQHTPLELVREIGALRKRGYPTIKLKVGALAPWSVAVTPPLGVTGAQRSP